MKNEDKEKENENTGIAMRVLLMTAILVMLCLFSVLSVSAVQVTENVKFQTPGTNTTFIMGSNFNFDTIEVHSSELRLNDAVISVCPSAGSIDFTLFSFSSEYRKWTESCSNPDAIADHTMGGLKRNTPYDVKVNGAIYGQYRSNGSGYVFFTYSGGYSDIVFEMEEAGAPPKFIAHFMTPEGEPYPFDVIISDGEWVQEFDSVTYIATEVPRTATYYIQYKVGSHTMFGDASLCISSGEIREFNFYALDPLDGVERIKPYIFCEERDANASISYTYDNLTKTLSMNLTCQPNKVVLLKVYIDKNLFNPPNFVLKEVTVNGEGLAELLWHGCWFWCHVEPYVEPSYDDEGNQDDISFGIRFRSSYNVTLQFDEIQENKRIVSLRGLFYNYSIVEISETKLLNATDVSVTYSPTHAWPEFVVPSGSYMYYIDVAEDNAIDWLLPVDLVPYTSTIFDVYVAKIADLDLFTFSVAAESPVAESSYSDLTHNEEKKKITVDVSTEGAYDWWGYFVLPDTVTVAAVRSRMPGAWHDLDELYDYTINPVDGYKIVVVRISPETEQVILVYKVVEPDLVITEKWLCWPENCTICYNVTNRGDGTAPACHSTALYVDGVTVAHDHVPVDLAPGESYTGCFNGYEWTYTPPSDNITVCADNNEALSELHETNNCLTNIWTCGDVNCDGKVTMSDVRKVFNRYLDPNYPLDLPWAADVNCDGKVTMSDVRKVFNRYLDPGYGLNCCCEGE